MVEAEHVTKLVQEHAPEIEDVGAAGVALERATIRIPDEIFIHDHVGLGGGRLEFVRGRNGECAGVEGHAVDIAGEKDVVHVILLGGGDGRGGVDSREPHAAELRVPVGGGVLRRRVPRTRAVDERDG